MGKSKEYIVKCFKIGATYKIFVAEHSDGLFHSGVLYTTVKPINEEFTIVDWHLKSFVDYCAGPGSSDNPEWFLSG